MCMISFILFFHKHCMKDRTLICLEELIRTGFDKNAENAGPHNKLQTTIEHHNVKSHKSILLSNTLTQFYSSVIQVSILSFSANILRITTSKNVSLQ